MMSTFELRELINAISQKFLHNRRWLFNKLEAKLDFFVIIFEFHCKSKGTIIKIQIEN